MTWSAALALPSAAPAAARTPRFVTAATRLPNYSATSPQTQVSTSPCAPLQHTAPDQHLPLIHYTALVQRKPLRPVADPRYDHWPVALPPLRGQALMCSSRLCLVAAPLRRAAVRRRCRTWLPEAVPPRQAGRPAWPPCPAAQPLSAHRCPPTRTRMLPKMKIENMTLFYKFRNIGKTSGFYQEYRYYYWK